MDFKYVLMEVKDSVAYITLNNPQKKNPINIDTGHELRECFDLCDYDDNIRLVVIRGAGKTFIQNDGNQEGKSVLSSSPFFSYRQVLPLLTNPAASYRPTAGRLRIPVST